MATIELYPYAMPSLRLGPSVGSKSNTYCTLILCASNVQNNPKPLKVPLHHNHQQQAPQLDYFSINFQLNHSHSPFNLI